MAAQFAALGLQLARPYIDQSDEIWDKGRDRIQRIRRRSMHIYDKNGTQRDRKDSYDSGYGRRRSDDYSDYDSEEDYDRRRRGRAKSLGGRSRRSDSKYDDQYYDSAYESEGSIPPLSRKSQTTPATRGMASGERGGGNFYYSENDKEDSDSDSSVLESEEDERLERKKRHDELLTGGIAAVATLHAAANVYGSMKARRARDKQLAEGTITKEEAKRQRYKHHMQDAASIGLAALSVKGAVGKWQTTKAKHKEVINHRQEREERHQRRLEKGISRDNAQPERDAAALRRQLPEYAGGSQVRDNGTVAVRPGYNRGYSRSMNDLSRDNRRHHQPNYGRAARRVARGSRYDPDDAAEDDGFDGYDIDNA